MDFTLIFKRQHLLLLHEGRHWIIDTGCPISFGNAAREPISQKSLNRCNVFFDKSVDAETISGYVGLQVDGLIGCDILNQFDVLIDLRPGVMKMSVSVGELGPPEGTLAVDIAQFQESIPYLTLTLGRQAGRYIFDTGAQLSYHVGPIPADASPCTPADDFWIPLGEFQTETHHASVKIQDKEARLRFGVPPKKLADGLASVKFHGIIGNETLIGRCTGYFPRRGKLHLKL
jgi:hypothetical protein